MLAPTFTDVAVTPFSDPYVTAYALGSDGAVYAWGDNTFGQAGNGTEGGRVLTPQRVLLPVKALPVAAIAPSSLGGFAIGADGNVYAWGANSTGVAGNGSVGTDLLLPVKVNLPAAAVPARAVTGYMAGSAIGADGNVYSWGSNSSGQIGNGAVGANVLTPVRSKMPAEAVPVSQVSTGGNTTYAVGANGAVYAWGDNSSGQVGNGTVSTTAAAPSLTSLPPTALPVASVSGSALGGSAIGADGHLYAWGGNTSGQVGIGTISVAVPTPVLVPLPESAQPVARTAGVANTRYAWGADGALYAWGNNTASQTGTFGVDTKSPVVVPLPPAALPVSRIAGAYNGYTINALGELFAWGINASGQLGNGSTGALNITPTRVRTLTVTEVSVGGAPATDLTQSLGRANGKPAILWTAKTPAGCGQATVSVTSSRLGESLTAQEVTDFVFGSPPNFDKNPASASTSFGGTFSASVTVEGDPAPALQWQQQEADGSWTDILGATGETVTLTGLTETTVVRVSASSCHSATVHSDAAVATVVPEVQILGTSRTTPVRYGAPGLAPADPANWEVTVTADGVTSVIDGETALERGTVYTIGNRLRSNPAPDASALHYAVQDPVTCTDSAGSPLPSTVFSAVTRRLIIGDDTVIKEPILCDVANQTSQVTLWTARIGGRTVAPQAGWELRAANADPIQTFTLDQARGSAEALPADYTFTASVPQGLSVIGLQKLDLAQESCAAMAGSADMAPQSCWVEVGSGAVHEVSVTPNHDVYRIVAGTPADLPTLPLTGGVGAWLFTAAGIGALIVAVVCHVRRLVVASRASALARSKS